MSTHTSDTMPAEPAEGPYLAPKPFNSRKVYAASAVVFAVAFAASAVLIGGSIMIKTAIFAVLALIELALWIWRGSMHESSRTIMDTFYDNAEEGIRPTWRLRKAIPEGRFEKIIIETKRHPLSILHWWIFALIFNIAVAWGLIANPESWLIIGTIWLAGMIVFGLRLMYWHFNALVITDRRIMETEGIFSYVRDIQGCHGITGMEIEKSFLSEVLAALRIIRTPYGTLVLYSDNQKRLAKKVYSLPWVFEVKKLISALLPEKDHEDLKIG